MQAVQKVIKRNITTSVHLRIFEKLTYFHYARLLRFFLFVCQCHKQFLRHCLQVTTSFLTVLCVGSSQTISFVSMPISHTILGPRSSIVIKLLSQALVPLKVHKIENFFDSDFEFYVISL
jgi:hypothetical protein